MKTEKPRALRALHGIAIASLVAAAVAGCSNKDAPVGPVNQAPATHKVTVTVGSAVVLGTCEGAADNPGDFKWELIVVDPELDPADYQRFTGSFSGLKGQSVDFPDVVCTMDRTPKSGDGFTLEFHVTEWDGADIWDDRMANSIGERWHRWTGGTDWINGPHTLQISGSSECSVMMVYSVDVD